MQHDSPITYKQLLAALAERDALVVRLMERIEQLEAENAQLKAKVARLQKNSSNSSKPPSSDIVKPPKHKLKGGKKRKIGGQPGHPKHERPWMKPDALEQHTLDACPNCGGELDLIEESDRVIQQAELVAQPIQITEHRAASYRCTCCGKPCVAQLPATVAQGGLLGSQLTAMVGYMKGACHCSYTTIQSYLGQVLGLEVSTGMLTKAVMKVSASLEAPHEQLCAALPDQPYVKVDETGHKDNGRLHWTWAFCAEWFTVFKVAPSRGSDVLQTMLSEAFEGVLSCDYFSAYRKYMGDFDVTVQFCLAHLIREVKFLTEHPNPQLNAYGQRVLETLAEMFRIFHEYDPSTGARFTNALKRARDRVILAAGCDVPAIKEAENLAHRFEKHGQAYFTFITTPGVEPTNNLAEQAIRFVVIDRKVTQGTRGPAGQRWCERIWTTLATCAKQGRNAYPFLIEAVESHFHSRLAPSLLPAGP